MEIEVVVQPNDEPFVAHQIEEIDTNGYLIDHDNSEYESDNQNDDDVDVELEKDEYNDVMAKIFDTLDDAYMFYNGYALLHGFAIRPNGGDKKRRRDLRTGCEAFLRININKNRKWIREMYKKCSHSAKAFFKDVFLAAVEARRAAEEDEDFKTMNSLPVLSSINPIEAKTDASYTRKMFEVFKKEWAVERAFMLGRTWAGCGPCWQYHTHTGNVPSLLIPSSQAIDLIISVDHSPETCRRG
nr:hypothetical protein [Tanacetum cinerariifolium]